MYTHVALSLKSLCKIVRFDLTLKILANVYVIHAGNALVFVPYSVFLTFSTAFDLMSFVVRETPLIFVTIYDTTSERYITWNHATGCTTLSSSNPHSERTFPR